MTRRRCSPPRPNPPISPGRPGQPSSRPPPRSTLTAAGIAELLRWATSAGSGLNERFAATLALFAQVRQRDAAFASTIVRFWSGDPIADAELRRRLKEIGDARPSLPPVTSASWADSGCRFAAKLLAAAGSAGWVILFDEVELIGRYSLQQRARSYAEIARWVRGEHGPGVPIAAVLAMTDDFEAAVITGRKTASWCRRSCAPSRPRRRRGRGRAAEGMRIIDTEMQLLTPPDEAELDAAYARLKELHGEVFGWLPPMSAGLSGSALPGCASTSAPGSMSGISCGSIRPTGRRPKWSASRWAMRRSRTSTTRRAEGGHGAQLAQRCTRRTGSSDARDVGLSTFGRG